MRGLLPQLILRVLAAGLLTVMIAAGWVLWDTRETARDDARITATRVAGAIDARPDFVGLAFGGVAPTPVFRDWQQFPAWTLIAPGICVEFGATDLPIHRRCGPYLAAESPPPDWFVWLAGGSAGARAGRRAGALAPGGGRAVTAIPDPGVIVTRAWERTVDLMQVAVGMAFGGALVTGLMVAGLLAPFRVILRGIERLRGGDFSTRQPRLAVAEFDAPRHRPQRDRRRAGERAGDPDRPDSPALHPAGKREAALARELHDEFGQCLPRRARSPRRSRNPRDHRPRRRAHRRDLRPDDGEPAHRTRPAAPAGSRRTRPRPGPGADGRQLAQPPPRRPLQPAHRRRRGRGPDDLALSLYRIAQECLTNANRHGSPRTIALAAEIGPTITLTTTDDGGAKADAASGDGHGLLGIRERVDALGGSFTLEPTETGNARPGRPSPLTRVIFPGRPGKPLFRDRHRRGRLASRRKSPMNDMTHPVARLQEAVAAGLVGHQEMVERLLVALIAGGHVLIEGRPASPRPARSSVSRRR